MKRFLFAVAALSVALGATSCRTVNRLAERAHEIDGVRVVELKSTAVAQASFSSGAGGLDPTGLVVATAEAGVATEIQKRMRRVLNTQTLSALAMTEVREGVDPLFRVDDRGNTFMDVRLVEYGVSAGSLSSPPIFYAIVDGRIILQGEILWDIRATGREPMPTQVIPGGIGNVAALASLEDVHIQQGIDAAVKSAANALVNRLAADRAQRYRR